MTVNEHIQKLKQSGKIHIDAAQKELIADLDFALLIAGLTVNKKTVDALSGGTKVKYRIGQ
ncbi:hypothetical protein fHeYen902_210 [Yersinia phage fHe-Yen9-02]|nr:hypothetical protein fHeYen902_210 [Yersinia phage fHe-Yen9-02]